MVTSRMVAVLAFDWADSNLLYGLGLVAVLLIGAAAVALVKRWHNQDASVSMSPSEQLAAYRSLYEQGIMSKEEFDRLRALLGGQLREQNTPDIVVVREPQTNVLLRRSPVPPPLPPPSEESVPPPPSPEAGNGQH